MPRRREPDPWPWPADNPVDRARRVAQMYRSLAMEVAPRDCQDLDANVMAWGQRWVLPAVGQFEMDDELTPQQAADVAQVKVGTIDRWRQRGLPVTQTVDGPRYLLRDLVEYQASRRRARASQRSAR